MNRMYVLYDAACGVCLAAREWCEEQVQVIDLEFVAANTPEAARLFPALSQVGLRPEELVVISDTGEVYREGHGWIMVLFALAEYRGLSYRLASPTLLPLARSAFQFLSKHRAGVSSLLGLVSDRDMAERLRREQFFYCAPTPSPVQPGKAAVIAHPDIHDGWTN